jgi:hypothetical protein
LFAVRAGKKSRTRIFGKEIFHSNSIFTKFDAASAASANGCDVRIAPMINDTGGVKSLRQDS